MLSASPMLGRRRVIGIAAAAAGLALLPFGRSADAGAQLVEWRGMALGAVARLLIHHHDRAAAERIIGRAVAEVARLEALFSLYRPDSVLMQLNRQGFLVAPPPEFLDLIEASRAWHATTGGAFDPSVQPLWALYATHFAQGRTDGPTASAVERALRKVGFADILANRDRIAFRRRGMALTLNGIAQGYITDRVVALLRAEGIERSFVDMGEGRALGPRPDGTPWQVAIAVPDAPERDGKRVAIVDRAIATSAISGFRFDTAGQYNHLLDPRSGASATRYRSVSVIAPTATAADAFSTACNLLSLPEIEAALRRLAGVEIRLVTTQGKRHVLAA